jgi:serine/threonine protein kinase
MKLTGSKRLCREALVWRQLKHPHVLPFIGIDAYTFRSTHHVAIVTPWRARGTLRSYMKSSVYRHSIDSYRLVSIET